MEEIEVRGNNTGLKCYINGVCDLTLMSKEEMDLFVASIVPVLLDHYQNYVKWYLYFRNKSNKDKRF